MNSRFSAVLLAGGKSSRMGRDKALIAIDGLPLWQRQTQTLEQLEPSEIFLAGPARAEWENARCVIIDDAQEECGPLGGMLSALRASSVDLLLVLAVDLPHMSSDYLRGLLDRCAAGKGIVPTRDRYEPLAAVYPKQSVALAEELLASGEYSLQRFAAGCVQDGLVVEHPIVASEAALFLNMNTPADLLAMAQ